MDSKTDNSAGTLLSVRSDVERMVDPDGAVLTGQISVTRGPKAEALQAAAISLDSLRVSLTGLGGAPLSAETARSRLTWSTQRVSTMPEYDDGRRRQTGRTIASTFLQLGIRDFDLMNEVEDLLSGNEAFRLFQAHWFLDSDNPGWKEVRSEAIAEAIAKGKDYATALGSELVSVEHIADVGLLGTETPRAATRAVMAATAGGGGGMSTPSLDPVPQRKSARIEARFRISAVRLTPG